MEQRPFHPEAPMPAEFAHNPEYQASQEATDILNQAGFEAYVVGGAVRDMLLGVEPKDFDLCTNAKPDQIDELPFERSNFVDTSQAYGVSRVRISGVDLELATFRKDVDAHLGRQNTAVDFDAQLEDDVVRRDLTINALAFDARSNQIIDYVGGLDDLDNGIIRFVGEARSRILEDPLRLLRAIRFKNKLVFEYDQSAREGITEAVNDGLLAGIPGERLGTELTNILKSAKNRRQALEDLDSLGVLGQILPELVVCKGVDQGQEFHAEGDVWQHTLLIMEALPADASPELIWAALLHDIGKPDSKQFNQEKGRITFHGHPEVSADKAREILNRLKFSNEQKANILWIIEHHINIKDLAKRRPGKQKKLMQHPMFANLIEHFRADGKASWQRGEDGQIITKKPNFDEVVEIWQAFQAMPPEQQRPSIKRDFGIDGRFLIEEFGEGFDSRHHGQIIGRVINQLEQLYADGEFADVEQAKATARQLLKQEKNN